MTEVTPKDQKTVLIVDDQEPTRMLIKAAIQNTGIDCQVFEATDGDSALAAAQQRRPDLVLLDIVLPDSSASGVLLCTYLCKDAHIKVVIISGQASKTIVQTCLNAGAIDYIPKPFSVEVLQERITEWLTDSRN